MWVWNPSTSTGYEESRLSTSGTWSTAIPNFVHAPAVDSDVLVTLPRLNPDNLRSTRGRFRCVREAITSSSSTLSATMSMSFSMAASMRSSVLAFPFIWRDSG
ncbi:Uncharacterised protein [Mycobacteroides abscessus subsp. abscessus]|nr:Uncharacterised protein [Mycobacteroides abscessus subsp. abscessus]